MDLLTVELHCHTYYSKDCLLDPTRVLEVCRKKGIDRVAITDHNTIDGALSASQVDPERVIIGEEIMTSRGELLGYFMKENIPPNLSPRETITRLRAQDAFISVSHPFDSMRSGSWQEESLREILDLVDAIEVFNARSWTNAANTKALTLAQEQGVLATAGSDAHASIEVGRTVLTLPVFHDRESFRSALSRAQIHPRRSSFLVHFFSRYATVRKALGWTPHRN
jgi:predicted metal-dependent phosphoesterase TrpH